MLQQPTAGQRAQRDPDTGHSRPDRDCLRPFGRVREHVREDGQRRGEHERGAHTHQPSREDQLRGSVDERRRNRSGREHEQAGGERALTAEPVAQAPGCEQQTREHEHVTVDDPLQLVVRRVQISHERRDRHVQDGVVERDDHEAETQHQQCPPAPLEPAARGALNRGHDHWRSRRPLTGTYDWYYIFASEQYCY